jgi:alkylation response protein AidB-like acyl-CoA dehydrogenase
MTATITGSPTSPAVFTQELRRWLADHAGELETFSMRVGGSIQADVEHERALLRLLCTAGWSRYGWPVDVGGLGGPVMLRAILYDELAAADVEIPEAFVILETLGPVLVRYAPDLAARHLAGYLRGDELWGQGFSEPEAGSDLAQLRMRARRSGDGFALDGQKVWTTLGQFAQYAAVLARTGEPESAHRGLTMFWVDLASPGVLVRPITAANGRDEFAEIFLDDVRVDSHAVIGSVGGGWEAAMFLLQYERGMYAWLRQAVLHHRLRQAALAAAEAGSRSGSVGGSHARAAFGQAVFAAAALRVRSLDTVRRLSAGEDPASEISLDKVLLGQAEQAVFDALRQLAWRGMLFGTGHRDVQQREEWFYSRASTIFGGAIDVQRDIIADRVLRLPRPER